jgi:hypothetical protein
MPARIDTVPLRLWRATAYHLLNGETPDAARTR